MAQRYNTEGMEGLGKFLRGLATAGVFGTNVADTFKQFDPTIKASNLARQTFRDKAKLDELNRIQGIEDEKAREDRKFGFEKRRALEVLPVEKAVSGMSDKYKEFGVDIKGAGDFTPDARGNFSQNEDLTRMSLAHRNALEETNRAMSAKKLNERTEDNLLFAGGYPRMSVANKVGEADLVSQSIAERNRVGEPALKVGYELEDKRLGNMFRNLGGVGIYNPPSGGNPIAIGRETVEIPETIKPTVDPKTGKILGADITKGYSTNQIFQRPLNLPGFSPSQPSNPVSNAKDIALKMKAAGRTDAEIKSELLKLGLIRP